MRVIIVGGGIGGCTLALMLHQAGIAFTLKEAAPSIAPLGVGINSLPHSVHHFAELGLLSALDEIAVRTRRLTYANHLGQEIWSEPRGLFGGYDAPQYSIHRGRLQVLLWKTLSERAGRHVEADRRLIGYEATPSGVTAHFQSAGGECFSEEGDVLIGADGIHSTIRSILHPDACAVKWNGIMMYRGAVDWPAFDQGDAMVIAGSVRSKLVLYPIAACDDAQKRLTNWVVYSRVADPASASPPRESWSRRGSFADVEALLEGFDLPYVDVPKMIASTADIFEYPMCDKDPLPWWTAGRVTLLGDAAHPMYPVGSNGSAQAILDARYLTDCLKRHDPMPALAAYEEDRRPKTTAVVMSNRSGGPEQVIDFIGTRAPAGFENVHDVATAEEIASFTSGYAKLAGFDRETLANKRR